MLLAAFIQAANCSNYSGSWRHPDTELGFLTPQYYQNIANVLEEGKFHLAFLDDRLALPSRYGGSFTESVRHGVRAVKLDLIPVLTAMALTTEHLGLGATYSTTYYHPFHIARVFATFDHLTAGRVGWNVVTSLNDTEAQNFGMETVLEHDLRYEHADEFMELVYGLWDTWEDGTLVMDREKGIFGDPNKVHDLESCKVFYNDIRQRAAGKDRDPNTLKVAPAVYVVVGETESIAREKHALIAGLAHPMDALTLLSEVFNYDFSRHGLDEPLSDEVLDSITGLRGFLDRVADLSGNKNPTVREFLRYSGRGTLSELPLFIGTPQQVSDQMEEWFTAGACDGFVIAATHMPGAYEDFVRMVVPELQRRGLFQNEYRGRTLRESLGLSRPTGNKR